MWSYSVMVITKDSESFNPGSSPGRTFFVFWGAKCGKYQVRLGQRRTCMPECPRGLRGQT